MGTLDRSLKIVIDRLVRNRNIPKYQFERAVEPFLSIFLEEALERCLGEPLNFVVAEFPLKKPENAQSTNADYLFRLATGDWLLVELKTERSRVRLEQLEVYQSCVGSRFEHLVARLETIENATRQKRKYKHLRSALEGHRPYDGKVQVLYVTPHKTTPFEAGLTRVQWKSFEEIFNEFESVEHPELWRFVSRLVAAV